MNAFFVISLTNFFHLIYLHKTRSLERQMHNKFNSGMNGKKAKDKDFLPLECSLETSRILLILTFLKYSNKYTRKLKLEI